MLPLSRTGSRSGRLPNPEAERCRCRSVLQLWAAWPLGCEYFLCLATYVMSLVISKTPVTNTLAQRACPNPAGVGMGRGGPVGRGGFGGYGRGGYGGGPRPATCYKCGGPNHFARDCQAQAMKCYACGKLGHISRDCPAPNGGPLSTAGKTCYQCGEAGHISRDCPSKQANGEVNTAEVDLAAAGIPAPVPAPIAPAA